MSYTRYHPSKGYSWEFKDKELDEKGKKDKKPDEPSSIFQRQRVDMLLVELSKKYPPRLIQQDVPAQQGKIQQTASNTSNNNNIKNGVGSGNTNNTEEVQIKQEPDSAKSTSAPGSNEPPPLVTIKQEKMDTSGPISNNSSSNISNNAQSLTGQGPNMKPPPEKRPRM